MLCALQKGKSKVHPRTGHEGSKGDLRYSSTLSLTSALDVVGSKRQDPAALPPGKDPVPIVRRLGGPQGAVHLQISTAGPCRSA